MVKDIQKFRDILAKDPRDTDAFYSLVDIYLDANDYKNMVALYNEYSLLAEEIAGFWDDLIERLEYILEEVDVALDQAEIMLAIGKIHENECNQLSEAMANYQRAFRTWPYLSESLDCARALYRSDQNWKLVIQLYHLELQVVDVPDDRIRIFKGIGDVYYRDLGDHDQAAAWYQKVIEIDPEHSETRQILSDLGYEVSFDEEPEDDDIIIEEPDDDDIVIIEADPVAMEVPVQEPERPGIPSSGSFMTPQKDPVEEPVSEPVVEQVAEPVEEPIVEEVVEPIEEPIVESVVEEVVEPVEEPVVETELEQFVWLAGEYESDQSNKEAAEAYFKACTLLMAEAPGDVHIGDYLLKSLTLDSSQESVFEFYLANSDVIGREDDVISLFSSLRNQARTRNERLFYAKGLASLRISKGAEDIEQTMDAYRQVLVVNPSDDQALDFLTDAYVETEKWDELVDVYEKAIKHKRRSRQEFDVLLRIGLLIWNIKGDKKQAEKYFRRVKLSKPKHPKMLEFYSDYFEETSNWSKYLSTMSSRMRSTRVPEEQVELGLMMARVAQNKIKNLEKAIDLWKGVLKHEPDQQEAREALHFLYRKTRKWNALIEFLKSEVRKCSEDESERKIELYLEMVETYKNRLRLVVMAIRTYKEILE